MHLEPAPIGRPDEAAWWTALSTVRARLTIADRAPFELDEFALVGRARRRDRPTVYVYRHARGGVVLADDDGRTYRWFRRRDGSGQFREADWRAAFDDAHLLHPVMRRLTFGPEPLRAVRLADAAELHRDGSSGACGARRAGWSRLAGRPRGVRHR